MIKAVNPSDISSSESEHFFTGEAIEIDSCSCVVDVLYYKYCHSGGCTLSDQERNSAAKHYLMGWHTLCVLSLGKPEVTVLKITIAPNTVMKWHSHPVPNVGYILSGVLTIEKKDGTKRKFVAGQAVPETVDSLHRGITGAEPVELIVFYAGTPQLPLSY